MAVEPTTSTNSTDTCFCCWRGWSGSLARRAANFTAQWCQLRIDDRVAEHRALRLERGDRRSNLLDCVVHRVSLMQTYCA